MADYIKVKRSAVPGKQPTTADLELSQLGVNTADGKLFLKKKVGSVESIVEIGTSGVMSFSGGTTGLTSSSSTGNVTLSGTLAVANGGTGVTSSTGSGSVVLNTSPTLTTPLLGTPTSGTLTNCTGYTFANLVSTPTTLSGYGITDGQPLDADLTAIAGLSGTSGLLKKTAADTWTLDTSSYLTSNQSITFSGDATGSGTTAVTLTLASTGTAGTYTKVTTDAKGRVTSGSTLSSTDIPSLGNISNAGAIGTTANLPIITTASGVLGAGSFGTTANTFCQGNDSRLSDTRTPTDGSVTDAKVAAGAAIAGSKITPNFSDKTDSVSLASGTTAQRPGSPSNGMVRYNSTLGCLESYVQGAWQVVANTTLDYGLITSAADTTFDYGALV